MSEPAPSSSPGPAGRRIFPRRRRAPDDAQEFELVEGPPGAPPAPRARLLARLAPAPAFVRVSPASRAARRDDDAEAPANAGAVAAVVGASGCVTAGLVAAGLVASAVSYGAYAVCERAGWTSDGPGLLVFWIAMLVGGFAALACFGAAATTLVASVVPVLLVRRR